MRAWLSVIVLIPLPNLEIILIFRMHSSSSTTSRIHILLLVSEATVSVSTQSRHCWQLSSTITADTSISWSARVYLVKAISVHLHAILQHLSRHILRMIHVVFAMHWIWLLHRGLSHRRSHHTGRITTILIITSRLRVRRQAVRLPILALFESTDSHEVVFAFLRYS